MRDGRLTGPALASFARHLSGCGACSREAGFLDRLGASLRASAPAGEGELDDLGVARGRTRLLAAFDGALVASGRRPARWLLAPAVAAAVVAGLFVLARERVRAPVPAQPRAVVHAQADSLWSRHVDDKGEHVVLERGALEIRVGPAAHRAPFKVVLPDGELEDIGTTFTVRVADGHTKKLAVQEGSVLLRVRGSAPVAVNAGETWTAEQTRSSNAGGTTRPEPIEAAANAAKPKREPRRVDRDRPLPRRAHAALEADEPAQAKEFRAAVRRLQRGDDCEAAAAFARYVTSYPGDTRAEDAAYLRVIALQRCGSDDDMKRAAREYLSRYPAAFRRAEVERLSR